MKAKNLDIPAFDLPNGKNDLSAQYFNIIDLSAFKKKYQDFQCEPHKHNYYSLFWVTQGAGDVILDDKLFNFGNNILLIIKPGEVANPQENWDASGWNLSVSCMLSISGQEQLPAQIFNTLNSASMLHITEANAARLMSDAFRKLDMEANGKPGFAHNELNDFLLYELLIRVCREIIKANAAQKSVDSGCDSVFSQFQRLVSQHHKGMHSVSDYADMLGVSARVLSAATEEKVHCSPLKYLHTQLSAEAKRELLYTDVSIKVVAYKLGFVEESHFIKFFKRQTGETPLQFRKRHNSRSAGR